VQAAVLLSSASAAEARLRKWFTGGYFMKFSTLGPSNMAFAAAIGAALAVSGAAMATNTPFSGTATFGSGAYAPVATTPGGQSGLTTTSKFYAPTFGTDSSSGTYQGGGGYDSPVGGLANSGPDLASLANMESFYNNNSFTVSAANSNNGQATTFNVVTSDNKTSILQPPIGSNANDVLQNSNPADPAYTLNHEPAGQDVAYMTDQQGFIDIATPGTYTFSVTSADDVLAVYIGGNGSTAGSGVGVAVNGFASGVFSSSQTTGSVDFTTAGLYNFETFYYQGYGGQGATLSITAPAGASAPTFFTAAVTPEPASVGLLGVGGLGLLLLGRRRGSA
jgi:hypothetical protein